VSRPVDGEILTVVRVEDADPFEVLMTEELLLEVAAGGSVRLLLASWAGPSVILGHGQPESDVDLGVCGAEGISVLRRITGGTGVLHDRDLAVALALPSEHPWARSITGLYGRFLDVLGPVLEGMGAEVRRGPGRSRSGGERSPICFEDHLAETLLVGERKAVGCAQARRARSVLVHGAILLHSHAALLARVFGVEEGRVARSVGSALKGVAPGELAGRLASAFASALDLEPRSEGLPELPQELAARRQNPRWCLLEG